MHGKTVRIRHCPATVSGRNLPALVTASASNPRREAQCSLSRGRPQVRRPVQQQNGTLSEGKGSWLFLPSWLFCLSILLNYSRELFLTRQAQQCPAQKWKSTDQLFHRLHTRTRTDFFQWSSQGTRRRLGRSEEQTSELQSIRQIVC